MQLCSKIFSPHFLVPTLLLFVMFLVYAPGLSGPFLFDDVPNITENQGLKPRGPALLDWWSAAQSSGSGALRRPIAMATFALQIADADPSSAFSVKLFNLVLHGLCGLLVYALAATLRLHWITSGGGSEKRKLSWLPALAMAIWVFNPLLLSTTLYAVQRMAQLSALFALAALVAYAMARARWARVGATTDDVMSLGLWILLFTTLAVLSKENGILVLWQIAVLEFCFFLGRWDGRKNVWILRLGILLFTLPILLLLAFTIWQWDWIVAGFVNREFSVSERLWTEARLLWFYLGGFLLPRIGTYGLFHDDFVLSSGWITPLTTCLSIVGWVLIIGLGWRMRRQFPWMLFAVLFYLVGHSIESGYLALELVFEHRNYLPTVAVAIAAAAGIAALIDLSPKVPRMTYQSLAAVFVGLLVVTLLLRSVSWSDELDLATASVVRHPDSPRSTHFYANTLIKNYQDSNEDVENAQDFLVLARHEFEALHQKRPDDLSALVMLFTLDSQFFSEVSEAGRWLSGIEDRVRAGTFQATDFAAMRVFNRCVIEGDCTIKEDRYERLLQSYSERVPAAVQSELLLSRATLRELTLQEKIAGIERSIDSNPSDLSLYYPLVSAHVEDGDFAAAHAVIIEILKRDSNHRQLSYVDALFARKEQGR